MQKSNGWRLRMVHGKTNKQTQKQKYNIFIKILGFIQFPFLFTFKENWKELRKPQ